MDDGRTKPSDLPSAEFRRRKVDHNIPKLIVFNNPKKCRYEGCNKKSKVSCDKCNIILCFTFSLVTTHVLRSFIDHGTVSFCNEVPCIPYNCETKSAVI